jgi:hypothetical protein
VRAPSPARAASEATETSETHEAHETNDVTIRKDMSLLVPDVLRMLAAPGANARTKQTV